MAEQTQNRTLSSAAPAAPFFAAPAAPDAGPTLMAWDGLAATINGCVHASPFLRDLLGKHDDFLSAHVETPLDDLIALILDPLTGPFETMLALRTTLRQARQKLMLVLGLADCGQVLPLDAITRALSTLADKALAAALAFELDALAAKGRLPAGQAAPDHCGIAILGLGKLGGHELNYSSDIDIVAYFDPDLFAYDGPKDPRSAAVALLRSVCGHLTAKTAEGFVFRVDLRLRPDPGSTPIIMTLDAAEAYYQSMGLTWERAAMIKARHCAGDTRVSNDFLERVRPFVWRRHLDFAAIDDVKAMKQRVHDHHGHDDAVPPGPGYDVKLGHGGIREIEFFAQIHQLIMGGRRPDLQLRPTCAVLEALAKAQDISAAEKDGLIDAYEHLRTAEHRLQMVQDAQTHSFPEEPEKLDAMAAFLGHDGRDAMFATLGEKTAFVSEQFDGLLKEEDNAPAAPVKLTSEKARETVARWRSGSYRALRAARAMALLERVLPALMDAFADTPDPDETLLGFDQFIAQLPAGVQIFSLLDANQPLIPLLANVLGQAPELSGQLARRPALFEGLINEPLQGPMPDKQELADDLDTALSQARDYETVLDLMRIWNGEARFQTGVRLLEGLASPAQTRQSYTDIAEVCVTRLLEHVTADFEGQHGRIPDGAFGVVALGSFGARELVTNSDLDLTFLYDAPHMDIQSDGERPLAARPYFARLAQRVITGLTSLTGEGRLYEVDMRLRPSGRSGIIAVSMEAYRTYHESSAWLWERMSLTKARYIAGSDKVKAAFQTVRQDTLSTPVSAEDVLPALWSMRGKLLAAGATNPGPWSLKGGDGGLTDADFLVEGCALLRGARAKDAVMWEEWWHDIDGEAGSPVAAARATLMDARSMRALLLPKTTHPNDAPAPARQALATRLGAPTLAQLTTEIEAARTTIYAALCDALPKPVEPPT